MDRVTQYSRVHSLGRGLEDAQCKVALAHRGVTNPRFILRQGMGGVLKESELNKELMVSERYDGDG